MSTMCIQWRVRCLDHLEVQQGFRYKVFFLIKVDSNLLASHLYHYTRNNLIITKLLLDQISLTYQNSN
jgi:hypothetical protein